MKKIFALIIMLAFLCTSVYAQEATKKTFGGTKTTTPPPSTEVKKNEPTKKTLAEPTTKTTQPAKQSVVKGKKPIKGRIASLTGLFMGGDGKVSKDQAVTQAEKGDPIVFVVGEGKKAKIYFVYNTDGTFGGKNLAKYANNKFVGIIGKTSTKNGLNFIIAEMIESMD
ncbi:MAG: hypothetical protein EPN82_09520 [Bacteroidetes bacterium]|nr:MAG: hypothetical protein EPN82_09520 [Bacteroidota bacterium]